MTDAELKAQLDRMERELADVRAGLFVSVFFVLVWVVGKSR